MSEPLYKFFCILLILSHLWPHRIFNNSISLSHCILLYCPISAKSWTSDPCYFCPWCCWHTQAISLPDKEKKRPRRTVLVGFIQVSLSEGVMNKSKQHLHFISTAAFYNLRGRQRKVVKNQKDSASHPFINLFHVFPSISWPFFYKNNQ